MIDYLGYNLTQYKAFRQLQLQYLKTVSFNQTLQNQVEALKQAYEQKCKQLMQFKNEEMQGKIKLQNHNLKYKQLYKQLIQHIHSTISCFKPKSSPKNQQSSLNHSIMNTSSNDKSIFMHVQQAQNLQKVCNKLTQMIKQYQTTKEKNTHLTKRIQTFDNLYKNEYLQKEKTQIMIVKQVHHLENQLQQLNQLNLQLQAKLNIKQKERRKNEIEVRHVRHENSELEQRVTQLLRERQDRTQQDTQFAIDFMTFQLHSIQSMFTRITQQTKCSTDLSNLMSILYSDYEQLSQIFRQKLQIQYDLQQLEQRYKSQKSSSTAQETLLIQTRRQIQAFRLELLKQKEVFRQKEQFIEEHFEEYAKINQQELKIKNYSYELQNRLYKQKQSGIETSERFVTTRNPTAREILLKRTIDAEKYSQSNTNTNTKNIYSGSNDFVKHDVEEETVDNKEDSSSMPSKKTSLRFKQTHNAEEIMNQIIKKDKANMEKILKDTRKTTPIPIYLGR